MVTLSSFRSNPKSPTSLEINLRTRRIGSWYGNARSAHRDPLVVEAYKQLQLQTDRIFGAVALHAEPFVVRIKFTRCHQPYTSDRELITAVRTYRILEVTSAAATSERLHPLLSCELGGPFDRFRAVHDLIGHVWKGFGFELEGEIAAWRTQDRMHSGLARRALASEVYGVNAARSVSGEPPQLKALVLGAREFGELVVPSGHR